MPENRKSPRSGITSGFQRDSHGTDRQMAANLRCCVPAFESWRYAPRAPCTPTTTSSPNADTTAFRYDRQRPRLLSKRLDILHRQTQRQVRRGKTVRGTCASASVRVWTLVPRHPFRTGRRYCRLHGRKRGTNTVGSISSWRSKVGHVSCSAASIFCWS